MEIVLQDGMGGGGFGGGGKRGKNVRGMVWPVQGKWGGGRLWRHGRRGHRGVKNLRS